ncbi:MAG: hypothetical protein R3D55_27540 [Chloroflexota bacterium]
MITLLGWVAVLVYALAGCAPRRRWGWAAAEALFLGSSQALTLAVCQDGTRLAGTPAPASACNEVSERAPVDWAAGFWAGGATAIGQPPHCLVAAHSLFCGGPPPTTTDVRQGIRDAGNDLPALV